MTTTSEAIVGFEDETEVLIRRLICGWKDLDVVSLVGMPGIGKTTLARRLYNHNDVVGRFDVCSWCTISQAYNRRKTLLELLGNLVPLNDNTRNDDELADKLRKHLLKKRYLIVIDDLWSIEAWDDLMRCFPDDKNSSRIILTTRQDKVASNTEVFSAPHRLRLFTDEESWCLLQKKVFGEESCPPQLEQIGEQIAQSCRGLPLAIILVAGVLAKLDKDEVRWEEVAYGLRRSCIIAGDKQKYMDIIELSFNLLPDQLKLCFLYFGEYFGNGVKVRKLRQRWVAEEFAVANGLKSAEDVAKDYMMELIDSNLVMVVRRSFSGKVKTIGMHDLLLEFCSTTCIHRWDVGGSDDSSSAHPQSGYEIHRLHWPKKGSSCSHSLITHSLPSYDILNKRNLLFDCNSIPSHELLTLKVLDLVGVTLRSASYIQFLINLRYLAMKGNFEEDPSWLSKLKNLETLILEGSRRLNLSRAIWGMVSLKHLEVTGKPAVITCDVAEFETYPPLEKLQWLSFAHLPGGEEFQKFVSKVPCLVKLRCMVDEPEVGRRCIRLPGLHSLNQLESLKVYFLKRGAKRLEVNFPRNLKKLTLSSYQLPWTEISTIGRLENLEVLKLDSYAFKGRQWDVKDEEFQKLKLLKFHSMNIPQWNFSDMSFPNLQLVIFRNSQLETFPHNLENLPLLKMIEVRKCNRSTLRSAREFERTQIEDLGNHEFKLIIKSRDEESMSEDEEELGLTWQVDLELRILQFVFRVLLVFLIISVAVKWADPDPIQFII
ncbi:putative late blight resistance protein homolog R1A-10 [Lycium ferocissimum]|uniref:putative late blight resistance protein homolog R1A-10 n=1 Tax=Lycium ferocissimum TaxID=112874 RepID=UPI0028159783|nr:putative late blight resistance protein homolog R1A-10 [Lycium ferocissimum]